MVLSSGEVIEKSEPVAVRVRCEGHLHTFLWYEGGPVAIPGHSRADLDARETLGDMGGKDCKCLALRTMVAKGEGLRYAPKQGVGLDPKPFKRCSEASKRAKQTHSYDRADPYGEYYDSDHSRSGHFMPRDPDDRKRWLSRTRNHYREQMSEATDYHRSRRLPLGWLLWHRRGLGVIGDSHTVVALMTETPEVAVVEAEVPVNGAGVNAEVRLPVRLRRNGVHKDGRPRWELECYIGPNGETCSTSGRVLGLRLLGAFPA